MATQITKVTKPTFIDTNAKIAGKDDIELAILNAKATMDAMQPVALNCVKTNDRAGVMLAMRVINSMERSVKTLENGLKRAARYRLNKDERAAFKLDGTLPDGIIEVVLEADEDEDGDDN